MSHLHRLRAAQLAIASDLDNCHPCKPVLAPGEVTAAELRAEVAAVTGAGSGKAVTAKRAPAKKKRVRR